MARTLAQLDAAVAALEARLPAPPGDPAPFVETVTATVTLPRGKVVTSTSGTKEQLEALVAARTGADGKG